MSDLIPIEQPPHMERAALVGLQQGREKVEDVLSSLTELRRLVESAGADVVAERCVHLRKPHPATLLSKGLVEDLALWTELQEAEIVILDAELSPVQQRNLEKAFPATRVLSRTEVILDIFATHAGTRESMTQVELAQLRYRRSRLIGIGIASAKMGGVSGGIATRGPGETQLEVDRRRIRQRVQRLETALEEIEKQREVRRKKRQASGLPLAGIAGYTNAGKSTLLNALTQAGVLAEDKLFATLDTTVRSLNLPGGLETGLIDTVGFVSKLPTELVAAFRATLEEITFADVILHVVDATSPRLEIELQTTDEVLNNLGCGDIPRLTLWNKIDQLDPLDARALEGRREPSLAISARTGMGLDRLLEKLEEMLSHTTEDVILKVPYDKYDVVARLHRESNVLESLDCGEGQWLRCRVRPEQKPWIGAYLQDKWPSE